MNPVEFDSVFNRTSTSWAIGCPDIVLMFQSLPRVVAVAYDSIDFAGDAKLLDKWSFDEFYKLFDQAKEDPVLKSKIEANQVVFFLHLLGLDTNGHAFRPFSKELITF